MGITSAGKRSVRKRQPAPNKAHIRASLASALFSGTQQRVLGLLFGQPARSFFATELISLAGAGSGAVQREVRRLEESGLITMTRFGNQKHYQANPSAPVFDELCAIVDKTIGPAATLRAALAPLEERVRFATMYGSVAKGMDRAQSDVDVLIVADDLTLEEVYAALAPAEKRLGRPVNPTLYTPVEFRRRRDDRNSFLSKVLAAEHRDLIGDEHAASRA
jgi:predicted nucleotidyltransferase